MPSVRQVRTLVVGVLIGVVFVLIYTSRMRFSESPDTRTASDFWHKTVHGLENKQPGGQQVVTDQNGVKDKDGDGNIDDDDARLAKEMSDRLKKAEELAKDSANRKAPRPDAPSDVVGKGNSAAHQGPDDDKKAPEAKADADGAAVVPPAADAAEENKERAPAKDDKEVEEQKAVEAELNVILKKSPVIIFSKSYCPFSKRAKGLLLDKYNIDPAPYVVELDEHEMGPKLQAYLGGKTGRTTVPNILINGVGIGGADDIQELDNQKQLVDKIVNLGHGKVKMQERITT